MISLLIEYNFKKNTPQIKKPLIWDYFKHFFLDNIAYIHGIHHSDIVRNARYKLLLINLMKSKLINCIISIINF